MKGFTKLHAKIVHSSIWREPLHVKVVWITMLALADQNGIVEGSIGGMAHIAGVTRDQCVEALSILESPDYDSSDGGAGERIESVPGGWLVLNHANYRDKQTTEQIGAARRAREYRARKALSVTPVTPGNARHGLPPSEEEADAEAELPEAMLPSLLTGSMVSSQNGVPTPADVRTGHAEGAGCVADGVMTSLRPAEPPAEIGQHSGAQEAK